MNANPIIALQERIRDLLSAKPLLKGSVESFVIEDESDLDAKVQTLIGQLTSMVVVVTTAKGDTNEAAGRGRLHSTETLTISIMRANTYDGPVLLDAVLEAMLAVHQQPVRPGEPQTTLSVTGHEAVPIDEINPPAFCTHFVHVRGAVSLTPRAS